MFLYTGQNSYPYLNQCISEKNKYKTFHFQMKPDMFRVHASDNITIFK